MFFSGLVRRLVVGLLLTVAVSPAVAQQSLQQNEGGRKTKSRVQPSYPELAQRMNITGNVRVALTVAPNGTVTDVQVIGGNPVLVNAVLEAVKRWRYEAAPQETTERLQFVFDPKR